jgi:tripartite-type tricarboxylate transporter receptor subunit TctC
MVTAGSPQPAVLRLNAAVREALATPLVTSRMAAAGVDGQSSSIEELAAFIRAESVKWGRVVREAQISVD